MPDILDEEGIKEVEKDLEYCYSVGDYMSPHIVDNLLVTVKDRDKKIFELQKIVDANRAELGFDVLQINNILSQNKILYNAICDIAIGEHPENVWTIAREALDKVKALEE